MCAEVVGSSASVLVEKIAVPAFRAAADQINDAAHRIAAVERREWPSGNFDTLEVGGREDRPVDRAIEGIVDGLIVQQDESTYLATPASETAQAETEVVVGGASGTKADDARRLLKRLIDQTNIAVLNLLARNNRLRDR